MLIYLDTSHLIYLAEEKHASPKRFREFMDAWSAARCTLALSLYHLIELRQHPDRAVREQRYALLEALLPVRTQLPPNAEEGDSVTRMADREIVQALLRKGCISLSGEDVEGWMLRHATAFPHTIDHPSQLRDLRDGIESPLLGWFIGAMKSAHAMGAEALSREVDQKYQPSPRLRDLPDAPVPLEQLERMMRIMEEGLADANLLHRFAPFVSPEQMHHSMKTAMEPMRQMMRRAGEVGPRAAYAELMGTSEPERDPRRLDRVGQESLFSDRVRTLASTILGVADASTAESITRWARLEDCPGTWLRNALETEIAKAEPRPDAGNAYDLEHSVHLPHVDVFTADKRIARYMNQVIDRGGLPPTLEGVARPIAVSKDLLALQRAVIRADDGNPQTS